VEEHQDVPSEYVVVMPVKGLRKRRRGRKSTAGRRGEPKELNQGNHGFRKKLAAACRKVSRYATVAWRKRNFTRRSETRGYCGSRKGVTVAERRATSHAKAAWGKENVVRQDWVRKQGEQEIKKRRKDRKRLRKHSEYNRCLRDVGLKQQLRGWKRIKDLGVRLPVCHNIVT
jgi:hypothetical protein